MTKLTIGGMALLVATAACDTTVSNPGPVQDEFLADRNAAAAMVNGAGRAISAGMNWIGYTGAAVAREIHPAGSTGSFGISARWQNGELNGDDADLNTHWQEAQRARWLAEETLRRLEAAATCRRPRFTRTRCNSATSTRVTPTGCWAKTCARR
jgi:hypothetical protein